MPSGQLVWRLALRSPGALSMRVRFESFDVAGALWLHAGSGAAWAGPYTGRRATRRWPLLERRGLLR